MSIHDFATAPEIRACVTHLYVAPVPRLAFALGEPHIGVVYSLRVEVVDGRIVVSYPASTGIELLFDLDPNDWDDTFCYAAWRELAGHTIPYAVYSYNMGGMLLKLSSADEEQAPRADFKHPSYCI